MLGRAVSAVGGGFCLETQSAQRGAARARDPSKGKGGKEGGRARRVPVGGAGRGRAGQVGESAAFGRRPSPFTATTAAAGRGAAARPPTGKQAGRRRCVERATTGGRSSRPPSLPLPGEVEGGGQGRPGYPLSLPVPGREAPGSPCRGSRPTPPLVPAWKKGGEAGRAALLLARRARGPQGLRAPFPSPNIPREPSGGRPVGLPGNSRSGKEGNGPERPTRGAPCSCMGRLGRLWVGGGSWAFVLHEEGGVSLPL